ncbi:MAG: hypothetical protein ACSHX9_16955 [Luteolibacter sp.]
MSILTRFLPALLIPLLITSCNVSDDVRSAARETFGSRSEIFSSRSGLKDIHLSINSNHNLDSAPRDFSGAVSFPAKLISSSTSASGVTSATLQLSPAIDGSHIDTPAKYRVIPNPGVITVSSKKLTQAVLENMESVDITATGRAKGKACSLTLSKDIHATELLPLKSGKTLLTAVNPRTGKTYQVTLDRARHDDGGKVGYKSVKNGDTSEFHPRKIYFSDGATDVTLSSDGLVLWIGPAGPGGSDYSYLDTQSARGEFD